MAELLLLTADDAAALLSVSVRTFREWDACGKIPRAITFNRSKRWSRVELEQWIAAGCPERDKRQLSPERMEELRQTWPISPETREALIKMMQTLKDQADEQQRQIDELKAILD